MAFQPMSINEDTADVAARGFQLTGTPDPTPREVVHGDADFVDPDTSAVPAAATIEAGEDL